MLLNEIVRFLFSTIENISIVILSLALFRIPIKYSGRMVLFISIILSTVSLFQRDYLHLDQFVTISLMIAYVILFKFLFNVPTFYALLVSTTGYLMYGVIQTVFLLIGTVSDLTSIHLLESSLFHGSMIQIISASATILLAVWMQHKKIGFMFVINRLTIKHMFSGFNLMLSFIILLTLITAQLSIISFNDNIPIIFAFIGLTLVLMIGITITYRKNKNDIKEKYERLKK